MVVSLGPPGSSSIRSDQRLVRDICFTQTGPVVPNMPLTSGLISTALDAPLVGPGGLAPDGEEDVADQRRGTWPCAGGYVLCARIIDFLTGRVAIWGQKCTHVLNNFFCHVKQSKKIFLWVFPPEKKRFPTHRLTRSRSSTIPLIIVL